MRLDLSSLAFGSYLQNGTGTPSWGTALGQSHPSYKFTYPGYENILIGMLYNSVNLRYITLPIGKGGKVYNAYDTDECHLAALFKKVYINDKYIDYPFIMLMMKEFSKSHPGRKSLKYSDKIEYNDGHNRYSNMQFFHVAKQILRLDYGACWFIYEVEVVNQDELHFKAKIVDEINGVTYRDSAHRKEEWNNLIDN